MIPFSHQGFQNWLLQPLFKEQNFKAPLHLASFTHALLCPCGPYSAQPRTGCSLPLVSPSEHTRLLCLLLVYISIQQLGGSGSQTLRYTLLGGSLVYSILCWRGEAKARRKASSTGCLGPGILGTEIAGSSLLTAHLQGSCSPRPLQCLDCNPMSSYSLMHLSTRARGVMAGPQLKRWKAVQHSS